MNPIRSKDGSAITVAQLKKLVLEWPEIGATGEPNEIWLVTGRGTSSPCTAAVLCNARFKDGELVSGDILLCPPDDAFSRP